MTDKDQNSDEVTVETTSVFRADFLNELDAPASTGAESAVSGPRCLRCNRRRRRDRRAKGHPYHCARCRRRRVA